VAIKISDNLGFLFVRRYIRGFPINFEYFPGQQPLSIGLIRKIYNYRAISFLYIRSAKSDNSSYSNNFAVAKILIIKYFIYYICNSGVYPVIFNH
jgi:hypothetical protein